MIITLIKREKGYDFVERMIRKYESPEQLEDVIDQTKDMKLLVELENWKYLTSHMEESLEHQNSCILNDFSLESLDFKILEIIKNGNPSSIKNLSNELNKNVGTIQSHINKLRDTGLIGFKKVNKNSNVPYCTFDEIKITI